MIQLRPADTNDAKIVERILTLSRNEYLPYAKSPHSPDETRHWVRDTLIPSGNVAIAQLDSEDVAVLATSVTESIGWIDQLYVLPGFTGRGIGTTLLYHAQNVLPRPIQLWTFQQNRRAICFYEHHGFKAIQYTNGENNEEKCPDVLYELC